MTSLAFLISIFLFVIGLWRAPKGTFFLYFRLPRKGSFRSISINFFLSLICAWYGSLFIQVAVMAFFDKELNNSLSEGVHSGKIPWATAIILVGIFIPIFEEICFRGYIFDAIRKWTKKRLLAAILTNSLFALCHPHFIASWFFGNFSTELRLKTESLIASIGTHFMLNASSLTVTYFSLLYFSHQDTEPVSNKIYLGILILGIVFLVIGWALLPKQLEINLKDDGAQ